MLKIKYLKLENKKKKKTIFDVKMSKIENQKKLPQIIINSQIIYLMQR